MNEPKPPKQDKGFRRLSPEQRRAIASKGGRTAHEKGTAHRFTEEEARAAGKKGGQIIAADREHMRQIGRIGGRKPKTSDSSTESTDP
jgi:general stress protein YciG